ncbi:MAG: C40 family peptidase [Paramuribaculum sp.]|nr:C40 family peptidase [Paramuribaculum sp.]
MSRKILIAATAVLALLVTSCHSTRKGITAVGRVITSAPAPKKKEEPKSVKVTSDLADPTKRLLNEANGWLGTPYKYGGNSKSGVDCSGMVCMVFNNALSIKLPRSSAQQGEWCTKIKKSDLLPGDLLFFTTRSGSSAISHVGMYIGNGNMIHASTSKGVIVSSLSEDYYVKTYHSSGRVAQYYAMLSGKNGKSEATQPEKKAPKSENPTQVEDILLAGNKKSGKEQVKDIAATVVKKTVDKASAKLVAATPGESTRAALEKQRRKLLDEVVEQKIDSIVSDFFD